MVTRGTTEASQSAAMVSFLKQPHTAAEPLDSMLECRDAAGVQCTNWLKVLAATGLLWYAIRGFLIAVVREPT